MGGAIVSDDPRTPELSSTVVCRVPREPIPREELAALLDEHLKLFPAACQEAFLRSFCARGYVTAIGLLDEAIKLQPKNLSMGQAASAIRHFALTRLECDLGGLHAKVRPLSPLSTFGMPRALTEVLLHVDGATSIEGLLRRAPGSRLQVLGMLADLARDEQIELLLPSAQRNASLRLPPMPAGAAARVDAVPKSKSPRDSGERKREEPAPKERLVTWAPAPASAPVPGPFVALAREPELPRAAEPIIAKTRQSSAAPTPMVAELPDDRSSRTAGTTITSRRWFLPAVVAASLAVGALAIALSRGQPTAPPPHPARELAAQSPTGPAPTLLPPVPVAKEVTEPSAADATDAPATLVFKIEVQPKYARVTLDGVLLTKAPIRAVIPKDGKEHEVRVESAGYHSKKLSFLADADVSMVIALDRAPLPTPRASAH